MNIIEMSQTTSQQRPSIIKGHVVQVIEKKHAILGWHFGHKENIGYTLEIR